LGFYRRDGMVGLFSFFVGQAFWLCCGTLLHLAATNIAGLLFVIFHFFIFIQQRFGVVTAMNFLPAAIPDRWT